MYRDIRANSSKDGALLHLRAPASVPTFPTLYCSDPFDPNSAERSVERRSNRFYSICRAAAAAVEKSNDDTDDIEGMVE